MKQVRGHNVQRRKEDTCCNRVDSRSMSDSLTCSNSLAFRYWHALFSAKALPIFRRNSKQTSNSRRNTSSMKALQSCDNIFSVLFISLSLCVLLSHPTPDSTSVHRPKEQVGRRCRPIASCSRTETRLFSCLTVLFYLILCSIQVVTNAFADFQLLIY